MVTIVQLVDPDASGTGTPEVTTVWFPFVAKQKPENRIASVATQNSGCLMWLIIHDWLL